MVADDNGLRAQAHSLLDQGIKPFPLDHPSHLACVGLHGSGNRCDGERGKHPTVKWGVWAVAPTHQLIDREWDKRGGNANIGISCGPSNIVVFDEDAAGELARWAVTYGIDLPDTHTVTTGRGTHYYYAWDHAADGRIGNCAKLVQGFKLDIRGDGGYVVGEGSQHQSGAIYTGNGLPMPPLPDKAAQLLLTATGAKDPTPPPGSSVEFFNQGNPRNPNADRIPFGERHNALVAYAGRLRSKGLDYTEAVTLYRQRWLLCEQPIGMIPEAEHHDTPPPDCDYPVTWEEAEAKLRSVYELYAAGNPEAADETNKPNGTSRRARVQWASEIQPERQFWLWESRIPCGTLSALAGRGGTGKTTYAIHIAAQLSNGTLPGEYFGKPQTTLIWSGEDEWATVLVPRLMAAGADLTKIGRLAIESVEVDGEVTPRFPLDAGALRDAITESGAVLVIIDPIASTMSADLHREADVRIALDTLARVAADTVAVVLFVRHFGKGGGNASDKMSGSHAFRDAARSVFLFAEDQDGGRVVVTQDKGNYAERGEESFAFRLENVMVPTDSGDVGMARVVELGPSEECVEDIINRSLERDDDVFGELSSAVDWLTDHFEKEGSALPSKDVKDAAVKAKISISTLKRAKLKLKIKDVPQGFPRRTLWVWPGTEPTEPTCPSTQKVEPTGTVEPTGAEQGKRNGSIPANPQSAQPAQSAQVLGVPADDDPTGDPTAYRLGAAHLLTPPNGNGQHLADGP